MKYKFGVMSSLYELESKSLRTAKLAMVLFMKASTPIVIYEPKKQAFKPTELLMKESNQPAPKDLKEVYASIKKFVLSKEKKK